MIFSTLSAKTAIGGTVVGSLLATAMTSLGMALQPPPEAHTIVEYIVSAVGIGGLAGLIATTLIVGNYKRRVDEHGETIASLQKEKANTESVDAIQRQLEKIERTSETVLQHLLNNK